MLSLHRGSLGAIDLFGFQLADFIFAETSPKTEQQRMGPQAIALQLFSQPCGALRIDLQILQ